MRILLSRTFLGVLLLAPLFSFAQTAPDFNDLIKNLLDEQTKASSQQNELQKGAVGAYLDVKIFPPAPSPNVPVKITIESFVADLYKANISWSVNGVLTSRGIGRTIFTFQNGPSGQTTHVSLSIVANTGEVVNKDFSFSPVGVTIMWEADTYTPPFYRGKAKISPEAAIRIIAVPDKKGTGGTPGVDDFVYDWKIDGNYVTEASGYGKSVFSLTAPKPLTDMTIKLAVSSIDDSSQSEMQIFLPQVRPFILFYENDPLLGVLYNKPLFTETDLSGRGVSFVAEPYFFSNERDSSPTLRYSWSINGKSVQNFGRVITLRNDTAGKGSSLVSLSVREIIKTFQSASKDIRVNFRDDNSLTSPIF